MKAAQVRADKLQDKIIGIKHTKYLSTEISSSLIHYLYVNMIEKIITLYGDNISINLKNDNF